ncbi:DUF1904 family protein [Paenibacillus hexagrammi]|uniref:DUF1904 domain-containing protein n=1 Tax=Paenibacillus hexagrammi TaxID=2908839 RepID=A0ABY3SHP9_9BACL|nr:DUF1904 family protein [Paenibacillus sp. YPD9-1]UJF32472.1 DUF1904 domain-containing protein [Paenibacillus sp. YPD9-1]
MPFLRFKGFDKQVIESMSTSLIEQFCHIADIPAEIVKLELLQVERVTNSPLSVEIYMFQREQEKHDAIAAMLDSELSQLGYQAHIFFVILSPALYYKEGKPIKEIPRKSAGTGTPLPTSPV